MHPNLTIEPIVGIIGGIGPESTVEYYKGIIRGYREFSGNDNFPNIRINSINMTEMLSFVDAKNYDGIHNLLLQAIYMLQNAGATIVAIASNTPHVVYDRLALSSPLPIISIVDATCRQAVALKLKKILLIGTRFTMQHRFYTEAFERESIELITPSPTDQETIHHIIFSELEEGIVLPETKSRMLDICNSIIEKEGCDGIILGCTELPLMFSTNDFDIAVLDTTRNHIDAIVDTITNK